MIGHATFGVDATQSRTGIDALVADAGSAGWAVGAEQTFGSASDERITDVIRRTEAGGFGALFTTFGVGTARAGFTRTWFRFHNIWHNFCDKNVNRLDDLFIATETFKRLTNWNSLTAFEGVSSETGSTRAGRRVTDDSTFRVGSAGSWTRIYTSHVDTSAAAGTVAVDDAFRTAIGYNADHVGQARALSPVANGLARGIGSAR